MKKYFFPTIAVILILICVITILPAPNPKRCAICDSIPYHAPALVNLATGEVGELTVYEPHPFKVSMFSRIKWTARNTVASCV